MSTCPLVSSTRISTSPRAYVSRAPSFFPSLRSFGRPNATFAGLLQVELFSSQPIPGKAEDIVSSISAVSILELTCRTHARRLRIEAFNPKTLSHFPRRNPRACCKVGFISGLSGLFVAFLDGTLRLAGLVQLRVCIYV